MTKPDKFRALTPQQKEKFRKLRLENPHMPSEEVLKLAKATKYVSKAQREAFEKISLINKLQKQELIEIALDISRQTVQVTKERG